MAAASIVGPKEGEGPLGAKFDRVEKDPMLGVESWEKAESELVKAAAKAAAEKARVAMDDFDYIIAGDLMNQSTGSIFGLRETMRPYLGIFGACSAIGEGMSIGGMLIDGGFASKVLCLASSHFCSAEKQFRFPLEFGSQRPPTSSWTVTGAAGVVLGAAAGPSVMGCTTGKMIDMGVKDAHNMGAAMAGAAADTIAAHFEDASRTADYYDLIITGDLGYVGQELLLELMKKKGHDIAHKHRDCGIEIFDRNTQDTHSGGSGCACSGVVFAAFFLERMKSGEIGRILFVPTGALMSPVSVQQGESIPGIAHAVVIENVRTCGQ
jgi:stage V sporulation protein AD